MSTLCYQKSVVEKVMRYALAATPTPRFGLDTTREMLLIKSEHTKENRLINKHHFISSYVCPFFARIVLKKKTYINVKSCGVL